MTRPGDNYAKGAVEVSSQQVARELYAHGARFVKEPRFRKYLALDESRLKAFTYRYHVSTNMVWQAGKSNCVLFSRFCVDDLLKGGVEQNFNLPPMLGEVIFYPATGGRHEMLFAKTASGRYLFYEPQPPSQKWTEWLLGKDYDFEL